MTARANRWMAAAVCGVIALTACSDALEQDTTAGQVVAVVESFGSTASLVSATDLTVSHAIPIPFTIAGGVSGLGNVLIMAITGRVAVIDLAKSTSAITNTVLLEAAGIGQGAAIQNDSVAWVTYGMALPGPYPYGVWRLNYRSGDTTSLPFATDPRAVALAAGNVFAVTVSSGGVSWLTVMDTTLTAGSPRITILDSISLTGLNARGIALGADGYLYVTSSGPLNGGGATEGRLAVVDPKSRLELAVVNGMGERLGPPVYHPSGRVLIPSVNGILEVNAATRSVTLGPSKGIKPAGDLPSILAIDQSGRVYAVVDHCEDLAHPPGAVHVLSPPPEYKLLTTIPIGSCPTGAAPATIP